MGITEFYHIYQRGMNGQVIFYCNLDRLVYLTIQSVLARRYDIKLLSTVYMFTHTHELARAPSLLRQKAYTREKACLYTREFNRIRGGTGSLFAPKSGSAPKRTEKQIRTNLAYLANNPCEKQLCRSCVDDRWSFIAYAGSPHPYSEPIALRNASRRLRSGIGVVKGEYLRNTYLSHRLLVRLFDGLDPVEVQQLTDMIIRVYSPVDYDAAIRYFGTYEKMVTAFDANAGSEYDLTEIWEPHNDIPYVRMVRVLRKMGYSMLTKDFLRSPPVKLVRTLLGATGGSPYQVRKFLHLPDPDSSYE